MKQSVPIPTKDSKLSQQKTWDVYEYDENEIKETRFVLNVCFTYEMFSAENLYVLYLVCITFINKRLLNREALVKLDFLYCNYFFCIEFHVIDD